MTYSLYSYWRKRALNTLINSMLEKNRKEKVSKDLTANRKEYSESWQKDAEYFFEKSYYNWMAKDIAHSKNILEIGCGTGYSTLALLNEGHKVISIEENSFCIDKTESLLKSEGFNVAKINNREIYEALPDYGYELSYKDISDKPEDYDVILIQGDIINDPSFIRWLKEEIQFSVGAVVCWLLGTHNSRGLNKVFDLNKVKNSSDARIYTQNIIYELCDVILPNNGYLHIVDRAVDIDGIDIIKNVLINHEDQASTSKMKVLAAKCLNYEEPKGMQMLVREITEDLKIVDRTGVYDDHDKIFVSILSKKIG